MSRKSSLSSVEAIDEFFDMLIKSRFNEMFGTTDLSIQESDWKEIKDVGQVLTGSTPKTNIGEYWDGDYYWITPAELSTDKKYYDCTERTITDEGINSCSLDYIEPGTILLSSRAPIGKVGIATSGMYCNQGFKNIKCGPQLNNEYLYALLSFNTNYLNSLGRGATFKEISRKIVESIKIPVPTIELQNDFALFVKQIDKTRIKMKNILVCYNQLIKSRFIEMFGKYFNSNENVLADLCTSIDSGKSHICGDSRIGVEPAILKLGAVFGGVYNPNENKVVDPSLFKEEFEVKPGDVLFSRKNTYDLVGTAAYVWDTPPKLMLPDLIFRINLKESINPIYFVTLINHPSYRTRVTSLAHGAASSMPNISKKDLQGLCVPLPPKKEQKQFAEFVQQVDKSKFRLIESLERLMESTTSNES